MPSNWLFVDTNFPTFTGEESLPDRVTTIQNYVFMLVEQLRYTLFNLDLDNMNGAAVDEFENMITDPIYAQIEDADGNITQLQITAEGLRARVEGAEGDISSLQLTQAGLSSQIQNAEGDISLLQQTAQQFSVQLQSAEGDISALQLTQAGLSSTVASHTGQISSLQQTVNGFYLSVSNGSNYSTISLMSGSAAISSQNIYFTGMVTFTDLSTQGQTVINGGNIAAGGTISGVTMRSLSGEDSGFQICSGTRNYYQLVGGIRYDTNGAGTESEARNRMFIYTQSGWAMKLESGSSASFEANGILYLRGSSACTISAGSGMLDLRGQVYINGTALDTYIQNVVGG